MHPYEAFSSFLKIRALYVFATSSFFNNIPYQVKRKCIVLPFEGSTRITFHIRSLHTIQYVIDIKARQTKQ